MLIIFRIKFSSQSFKFFNLCVVGDILKETVDTLLIEDVLRPPASKYQDQIVERSSCF